MLENSKTPIISLSPGREDYVERDTFSFAIRNKQMVHFEYRKGKILSLFFRTS